MIASVLATLQSGLDALTAQSCTSTGFAAQARALRLAAWEEACAHHRQGASGETVVRTLSACADAIVRAACDSASRPLGQDALGRGVVVCALGGFGRNELSPHSDLDVCLLYREPLEPGMEALNAFLVPFFWDAGFDSGYVLQSVDEARELAMSEPAMLTSYLMSRPLWGNAEILAELKVSLGGLDDEPFRSCFKQAMRRRDRATLSPQHAERFSREPNLKEQAGGLRDYHAARWMLALAFGDVPLDVLAARGIIPPESLLRLNEGLDFLWRVRNELHWWRGRRSDTLTFAAQEQVARAFDYGDDPGRAMERLMQDYYAAAHAVRDFLVVAARACHQPDGNADVSECSTEGDRLIFVSNGELHAGATDKHWFAESPPRLMRVFWESARKRLPIADATLARIQAQLHLVNEDFQSSDLVRRFFFAICAHADIAGRVLRQMAECGLLGAYLPEFARVQGLVRHKQFHSFPVDEHTLRALEALGDIPSIPGPVGRYLEKTLEHVQEPSVLTLAILFHDLGKAAAEEGHVEAGVEIAERCAMRSGWPPSIAERVGFLVRNHMLMNEISMYRDTDDPALVKNFADTMRSDERLRQLLLLSYCDLRAVAPGVWNDWKGALLVKLSLRTERMLSARDDGLAEESWRRSRAAVAAAQLAALIPGMTEPEADERMARHLDDFGDRYLIAFNPHQIADHVLALEEARDQGLVMRHIVREDTRASEVVIVTADRPGLFASIAGAFTCQGAAVQSAGLFTSRSGAVVDSFHVSDSREARPLTSQQFQAIERILRAVLFEGDDIQRHVDQSRRRLFAILQPPAPVATRVSFDDLASSSDTVLDVETGDRTGLLYDMAAVLSGHGVSVLSARIDTDSLRVRDAFHIQENGKPLTDPALRERLRDELHARLDPLAAAHAQGDPV